MQSSTTYYEILNLDPRISNPSPKEIKAAFHAALLRHHPDKASTAAHTLPAVPANAGHSRDQYSIDQIIEAYQTLIDSTGRETFDVNGQQNGKVTITGDVQTVIHTGFEVHDLDELDYNEDHHCWQKSCRCGDARSYVVEEQALERVGSEGEIYVACAGCSLFIKVLFDIADDHGSEKDQPASAK